MRRLVLPLVLAAALAVGCTRQSPTATPTPTVAPAATPAATDTPSPVQTPSPGRTPQATVFPSATATPSATPTPTPAVRLPSYHDDTQGFGIEVPDTWTADRGGQDGPLLTASGPGGLPLLYVSVDFEQADKPLKDRSDAYLDAVRKQIADLKVVNEGPTSLDSGEPAYAAEYTYTQQNGGAVQGFTTMVAFGLKTYRIEALSTPSNFALTRSTIQSVIRSFVSYEPRPYGIDLQQAIVVAGDNPMTLDPHLSQDITSHQYVLLLYSGLVSMDRDFRVQPDLAESWALSDDGTAYTLTLRENAAFQDGRRVTADDVKYSLERATDAATGSPTTAFYLGDIVGVNEKLSGRARSISGVQVVDDRTVRVQVDGPKAYFLAKLAYPTAFVVDRYQVERGGQWWQRPNGTGPYGLRAYEKDQVLVLQRNDRYYGDTPLTQYVVFRLFQGVPIRMYEAGELDAAEVGQSDLERVRDPGNPLSKELKVTPQLTINYAGFNTRTAPFNNPDVRRAFAMAVDRDRLLSSLFNNTVPAARGLLPPGMPGYSGSVKGIAYDPQAAKTLLDRVYPDPSKMPRITYTSCGRGTVGPIESALVQFWRVNLGVEVEVRLLEPENCTEELQTRPGNLFSFGWVADYPDPENVLDVLFHSGMSNNLGGYSNGDVDRMLEEARVEPDVATRLRQYGEIERTLLEDSVAIPLYHDRSYLLVKPYLRDFQITPQGLYTFATARLDGKGG